MRYWLLIRILFAKFLFCYTYEIAAQQPGAVFYHLTTKNGLSCNRASVVIQDSKGFYWIGTEDGLNRFDGSNCKVFRNIKNDSTSISNNNCNRILEDANGDIWISTSMGINKYDYKKGKFERFFLQHPDISFEKVNSIKDMQKDEEGNIWIASRGLWQYNIYSHEWRSYFHDPKDLTSIPEGLVINLQYDRQNNFLWMRTDKSYVLFDLKNKKFFHKKNNSLQIDLLEIDRPSPFSIDVNSTIWFADEKYQLTNYNYTDNSIHSSLYRFTKGFFSLTSDTENRIWVHYWYGGTVIVNPGKNIVDSVFLAEIHPQSALRGLVKNFYKDRAGIYWICSSEGVSIYDPNEQSVRYFILPAGRKTPDGESCGINSMAEEDENSVWLGTNTGLCKYDLNQNKFRFLDHLPANKNMFVKSLYKQDPSTLWIGTGGDVFIFDVVSEKIRKKIPVTIHTEFITADAQNNIWVGSWTSGLYKFSAKGQLLQSFKAGRDSTRTILQNSLSGWWRDSSRSYLWIGYNGGFSRLDFKENKFQHFKILSTEPNSNAINVVNCLLEEKNGNLWLGTNSGGLAYFNRSKNSFTIYTQSDGLMSNYVNAVLQDRSGKIWLATSNGLCMYNPPTNQFTNVPVDLEMSNNDFLPTGLLRKNKKMLFFSGSRLVEIDPLKFQQNKYPSQILLSSFKIFDKEASLNKKQDQFYTSLSYNQNFFSIEYSLLNPNPNSAVQYAYKLDGFDPGWINARERRIAYYTNVPPGTYSFHVKAIDPAGKNYFSVPVQISISPPFWKTWWFISLGVITLITGLYFIYRYRIAQVKKVYALRSKISQDLHDEIGATLSSIHVYSSVAAKAINKDPDKSLNALQHINENTLQVMENMSDIVWAINANNSGETSLEGKLKNYGYELLTPLNIQCIYWIDKDTDKKLLNIEARKNILLIIKEAMNNIAKYSSATEAMVKLEFTGKNLRLEVADNGKGLNSNDQHSGNGMYNMKQRTESLGGQFHVSSLENKGTTIHCSIPITNISD